MEIKSLYDVFNLILSSLTVFTALLFSFQILFIRKSKTKANYSLSFFFFAFAIVQSFTFFNKILDEAVAIYNIAIFTPATLSLSPAFYSYVNKITGNFLKSKDYKIHFAVPATILFLNTILFFLFYHYTSINDEQSLSNISQILLWINVYVLVIVFTIQNIFYIYKTLIIQKKHNKSIGDIFSYDEGINLSWIKTFIIGYLVFIVLVYITSLQYFDNYEWLFDSLVLVYLIFAGVNGNRQVDIYFNVKPEEIQLSDSIQDFEIQDEKENIKIDIDRIDDLKLKVRELVETKKLYLNQELSLVDIAKQLDSNTKYISEAINKGFNKNFIAFINDYRIEAAKKSLKDPLQNYLTIEAIGWNSGFKSKSTFNNTFKKLVGVTPSEFKERN